MGPSGRLPGVAAEVSLQAGAAKLLQGEGLLRVGLQVGLQQRLQRCEPRPRGQSCAKLQQMLPATSGSRGGRSANDLSFARPEY